KGSSGEGRGRLAIQVRTRPELKRRGVRTSANRPTPIRTAPANKVHSTAQITEGIRVTSAKRLASLRARAAEFHRSSLRSNNTYKIENAARNRFAHSIPPEGKYLAPKAIATAVPMQN